MGFLFKSTPRLLAWGCGSAHRRAAAGSARPCTAPAAWRWCCTARARTAARHLRRLPALAMLLLSITEIRRGCTCAPCATHSMRTHAAPAVSPPSSAPCYSFMPCSWHTHSVTARTLSPHRVLAAARRCVAARRGTGGLLTSPCGLAGRAPRPIVELADVRALWAARMRLLPRGGSHVRVGRRSCTRPLPNPRQTLALVAGVVVSARSLHGRALRWLHGRRGGGSAAGTLL